MNYQDVLGIIKDNCPVCNKKMQFAKQYTEQDYERYYCQNTQYLTHCAYLFNNNELISYLYSFNYIYLRWYKNEFNCRIYSNHFIFQGSKPDKFVLKYNDLKNKINAMIVAA